MPPTGFTIVTVHAEDPNAVDRRTRLGARVLHCESCERPLATVQNFVRAGFASIEIPCACGVVTALAVLWTRRADAT